MKKSSRAEEAAEMRDEYDFTGAVRGKYALRFAAGTNVVVLDPDVAEVFADGKAVNTPHTPVLTRKPRTPPALG
jgi:hypothetical protein